MLKVRNYDLDIIVIYRPPHTNKQLFVKELERVIQRVPINRDIIMFGDYNIDILEDKLDHIACSYLNMLSSRGLQCGIQDITREAVSAERRTATSIDHVFVRTESASEVQAYLLTSPLADHYLTGLTAVIGKRMPQNVCKTSLNNKAIEKKLGEQYWNELLNYDDPISLYSRIKTIFCNIYMTQRK
ncbi:unnamed protein product [Parnassius apollo]|uniref:(apollo) hypothetical protein n=1 Tax=Parnassius apollo TaxID=110799 RepID=A0A8S3WD48_PARAO|nr:unnamed protein product [Parnassius apollo]